MPEERFHHEFDREHLALKLNVSLAANPAAVDPVVQRIMQIIRETECVRGKEAQIELALAEALANAIVHGAKSDPSKCVECDVACDQDNGMLIIVRDPGEGFDPACVPSPVCGQNIFSNHGRGIFLINELMDDVKFDKNGTEIRMMKRLSPRPKPKPKSKAKSRPKRKVVKKSSPPRKSARRRSK